MNSSPPHDPQRALMLAIRSLRLLGIVSTLFGVVIIVPFGYLNRSQQFRVHFIALGSVVWLIPGLLYLTCSMFLQARRRLAATGAMIVTFTQLIFAMGLFIANFLLSPISAVPVVMSFLWIVALLQLLVYLRQSKIAVRNADEPVRGFEPIVHAQPVENHDRDATES